MIPAHGHTRRHATRAVAFTAVGGLVVAAALAWMPSAQAATVPTADFALTYTSTNFQGESNQTLINEIAGYLPKATVGTVLNNLNRTGAVGGACTVGAGLSGAAVVAKVCFESGDNTSTEWTPQGITTSFDQSGGGYAGRRVAIVTWYDTQTELTGDKAPDKGLRVSVLDLDSGKYRLALLVEPRRNSYDNASYRAVELHGGGLVWYGNHLYVADTKNGIRVFDLSQIFDLNDPDGDTTDKIQIGRQDGVFYAHSYRYAIPQVGSWKQATPNADGASCSSSGPPKFSYLALDRVQSPMKIVTGEYCDPPGTDPEVGQESHFGRVGVWNASTLTGRSGSATATAAYRLPEAHLQGAVSAGGTWYLSHSRGSGTNGMLVRYTMSSGAWSNRDVTTAAIGCEDLSYAGASSVWSVSEYVGSRVVYALNPSL